MTAAIAAAFALGAVLLAVNVALKRAEKAVTEFAHVTHEEHR